MPRELEYGVYLVDFGNGVRVKGYESEGRRGEKRTEKEKRGKKVERGKRGETIVISSEVGQKEKTD